MVNINNEMPVARITTDCTRLKEEIQHIENLMDNGVIKDIDQDKLGEYLTGIVIEDIKVETI